MARHESPSVSVFPSGDERLGSDPFRTVLWVRGEHDIASRVHLSVSIAKAARLNSGDILVDLSGVTFMDASTIGALVVARNGLRSRSRSLSVRAPSPRALRLLHLCGLGELIDGPPAPLQAPAASALGSWVDVPASEQGPEAAKPPASERVHPAARPVEEPAVSIDQSRSPS